MDYTTVFSIIIPVYNVEKYIERCLNSILSQTYPHYEVLLINDGSTDRSGRVCDFYSQEDLRIKVFHKSNGGVSSARNLGLKEAIGRYITFVDSDDFLGKDTLADVYNVIKHYSYDIIEIPCTYNWGSSSQERVNRTDLMLSFWGVKSTVNYWFYNPRFEACTRFYNKKLVGDICFNEGMKVGEDTLFFFNNLLKSTSYVVLPSGMYYYCYREDSVMNTLTTFAIVEHDILLLKNVFANCSLSTHLLCNFTYRVVMSKLRTKSIVYNPSLSLEYMDAFLHKISCFEILISDSPAKVKVVLIVLKAAKVTCCVWSLRWINKIFRVCI